MNEPETGRFLAMVTAIDPKMPQPDPQGFVRAVWARQLADVPFDAAELAMQAYYRSERYIDRRETISPADVVQWWNARRRPNEREQAHRALPAGPQRAGDTLDAVAADLEAQDRSLDIVCPHCRAERDAYCRNPITGDLMRASHWQRIRAARQENP